MMDSGKTPKETEISKAALRHPMQTLRLGLTDVGPFTGRSVEVVDLLNRSKVDAEKLQNVSDKNHAEKIINKVKESTSCFGKAIPLLKVG